MSKNKTRTGASCLAWSLVAWCLMAVAIFGLQHDLAKDFDWWLLPVIAVPSAAFCTVKAMRIIGSLAQIVRVIFWMLTLAGAALIVLLTWGQLEVLKLQDSRKLLILTIGVTGLVALRIEKRRHHVKRADDTRVRWIADCAAGAVCLAILAGSAFLVFAKIYVPLVGRKAGARWAAIGRPMPEFEKNLRTVEENESMRDLTLDLHPFGVVNFYKWRPGGGEPDKIDLPKEYTDFSQAVQESKSDKVVLTVKKLPDYLDQHRGDLDRLYQGVLQRVPPVWSFVPTDGMKVRVPGYLSARKLSQIICADAIYRYERGDANGAARAVAAGMKMTENLAVQPVLVSPMIRIAIEALFANAIVRLPENADALQILAEDVKSEREQLLTVMQFECWASYHAVRNLQIEAVIGSDPHQLFQISPLPSSLIRLLWRPKVEIYVYNQWTSVADQIGIIQKASDLASTDLGADKIEAIADCHPTLFYTGSRAWLRINLTLLLREQAELIRWSRAQMQAGKSGKLGEPPSVVIPTSKWLITGDAATNSVSLKLTPAPKWTTDHTVIDDAFFLLPLDGSKSWTFAKPQEIH
jgi:hypothetical protein